MKLFEFSSIIIIGIVTVGALVAFVAAKYAHKSTPDIYIDIKEYHCQGDENPYSTSTINESNL